MADKNDLYFGILFIIFGIVFLVYKGSVEHDSGISTFIVSIGSAIIGAIFLFSYYKQVERDKKQVEKAIEEEELKPQIGV